MLNRLKKLLPGNSNTSSADTTAPETARQPEHLPEGFFICPGLQRADVHTTQETVSEAAMGKQQYAHLTCISSSVLLRYKNS